MRFRLRLPTQELEFDADEVTIGRGTECAVTVDDTGLSRIHAAIRRREDGFEIIDLQSRNGTWVNGERIRGSKVLRHGDRIIVGVTVIVFLSEIDDEDPPASSRRIDTGRVQMCSRCRHTYPLAAIACSRCGHPSEQA